MRRQTDTEQFAETVARAQGNDDAAPDEQGEYQQYQHRADEPEFLADDSKDKVVLRFG